MKKLQILGVGCARCARLADNVEAAARQLGLQYELEKVMDIDRIMEFDVMMTPALAVDGKVILVGKVPTVDELKELLAG